MRWVTVAMIATPNHGFTSRPPCSSSGAGTGTTVAGTAETTRAVTVIRHPEAGSVRTASRVLSPVPPATTPSTGRARAAAGVTIATNMTYMSRPKAAVSRSGSAFPTRPPSTVPLVHLRIGSAQPLGWETTASRARDIPSA